MDAFIAEVENTQERTPSSEFKSRRGALVWCFRKSRDNWKEKYQAIKAQVKGYKNRVTDLTKSRDQWKLKAEQANAQRVAREVEIVELRAQLAAYEAKKNCLRTSPR